MRFEENIVTIKVQDGIFFSVDADSPCHLFKKEELNAFKAAIENTLLEYDKQGITEEYIDNLIAKKKAEEEKKYQKYLDACKEEKPCNTYLYLIKDTDLNRLKIGKTVRPVARLKQLQCANSNKLELLYAIPNIGYMEDDVHRKFKDLKTNGEWFINDGAIIKYFKELIRNERY